MRIIQTLVFCAGAAVFSMGCEVHERHSEPVASVGVSADVAVDEPQGEVVAGPGVVAIDTEPDPGQRQYIYDEGYPPGTYLYDNYYYYGGYRYPHDLFVNNYVHENIRQRRFIDKADNQKRAQQIEQRHKATFAQNHGVRKAQPENRAVEPRAQEPARKPETPKANVERPEVRSPANEEHPKVENRPNVTEQKPNAERPENRPNVTEHPNVERPENRPPTKEEHRPAGEQKVNPAKEPQKPGTEEPKHEEGK